MLINFTWKNCTGGPEFPGIQPWGWAWCTEGNKESGRVPEAGLSLLGLYLCPPPAVNLPPGTAGWGRPDPSGSPQVAVLSCCTFARQLLLRRLAPVSGPTSPHRWRAALWSDTASEEGYSLVHWAQGHSVSVGPSFWMTAAEGTGPSSSE